ncbi:hypothetical protein BJ944DRAFT_231679 [Cunninghamella echinulata]|nr:hypothetical protein BJ944DRAFT_231679 [Cunninghamella echinulata]
MRTSRGLQITSLIVLSPVLLILLSLLIILFTTLYSQLKIWCSPLLPYYDPSLSKITTTAFSTMTYYNNTSSSIMYENAPESKSPSSSMTDTTPSRPATSSSSNITDIHHPPNSFFRLKGLKRKSSTSLLLAYFGITLFVGIFYFQKLYIYILNKSKAGKKKKEL